MADTMTLEQVRDWHCRFAETHNEDDTNTFHTKMADAIDAAIKQRERDAKDAARLDWFDTHAYTIYKVRDVESGALFQHVTVVDDDRFPRLGQVRGTIREAIDAAMVEESGNG